MATANVQQLTVDDFEQAVSSGVALVDFWAPWCGPCRMLGPVVDEIADELAGKVCVAKVNVDEAPALAAKFGVRAIPYLVVFQDGRPVEQIVGVQSKSEILAAIGKHL